jgi:MFS superfamily sulfate permease-like transporter
MLPPPSSPHHPRPKNPGLVRSRHKVTRSEYLLLLATFLAIMQFELEMGVAVGIVLCLVYFAVTYARVNMTVRGLG